MKKKLFKTVSLAITGVIAASMAFGCGSGGSPSASSAGTPTAAQTAAAADSAAATATTGAATAVTSTPMQVTLLYNDNPSYPFQQNWLPITEFKKRMNVDLVCQVVPTADYTAKKQLLLNSGSVPDILDDQDNDSTFALNGVLLPVSDYLGQMPNLNAYVQNPEYKNDIDNMRLQDGKMYQLPRFYESGGFDSGLAVRKDLLDKYNLPLPQTYDDLYNDMAVMKQNDPNLLPMTVFWGIDSVLNFMSPSWNFAYRTDAYYNWDDGKYEPSSISPQYKSLITYLNKCYANGLMDPEIFTADVDQWTAMMTSGKSAVTFCWSDQLESVNSAGKESNPDFNLINLAPLKETADSPVAKISFPLAVDNFAIPQSTASRLDFDRFLQFVDWWLYSDEGVTLTNWGVEGISYQVDSSGKKVFTQDLLNSPNGASKQAQMQYGLFGEQLCGVWPADRYAEYMGPAAATITQQMTQNDQFLPGTPQPKISVDDSDQVNTLGAPIKDYVDQATQSFITGAMNLTTDWHAYVQNVQDKNIQQIVDIINKGIGK